MNLNQVTIPVMDLSRSIAFYQKLGLKLIVESQPHYVRFLCPEGGSTFSLHLSESIGKNNAWVYFEVEELDQKVTLLKPEIFI